MIVQYGSSKYKGKRICSAGVNVGPEKIRFKREVNGRKVCKELIARIEPRGCASETGALALLHVTFSWVFKL